MPRMSGRPCEGSSPTRAVISSFSVGKSARWRWPNMLKVILSTLKSDRTRRIFGRPPYASRAWTAAEIRDVAIVSPSGFQGPRPPLRSSRRAFFGIPLLQAALQVQEGGWSSGARRPRSRRSAETRVSSLAHTDTATSALPAAFTSSAKSSARRGRSATARGPRGPRASARRAPMSALRATPSRTKSEIAAAKL